MTEKQYGCVGCLYADWHRTSNGRLHPDGVGQCNYPLPEPDWPHSAVRARIFKVRILRKVNQWETPCPAYTEEPK